MRAGVCVGECGGVEVKCGSSAMECFERAKRRLRLHTSDLSEACPILIRPKYHLHSTFPVPSKHLSPVSSAAASSRLRSSPGRVHGLGTATWARLGSEAPGWVVMDMAPGHKHSRGQTS